MEELAERLQPHDEILEHKALPAIEEFANALREIFLTTDAPEARARTKSPHAKNSEAPSYGHSRVADPRHPSAMRWWVLFEHGAHAMNPPACMSQSRR